MNTQWTYAFNGRPIGLRYEALPAVMRRLGVKPAEREAVENGVAVLERDYLRR